MDIDAVSWGKRTVVLSGRDSGMDVRIAVVYQHVSNTRHCMERGWNTLCVDVGPSTHVLTSGSVAVSDIAPRLLEEMERCRG